MLAAVLTGGLVAGCGAFAPAGSVTIVPGDPVITAAPPVAVDASPSALPRSSAATLPDAAAAADAVKAFSKTIRDPSISYRVTATLVERFAKGTIRTAFTAAVSGEDYRGTAKSGKNTVGFAYVDGQSWAKANKSRWFHVAIHQSQADDAVRPFETLCWLNDLEYTGRPEAPADGFAFACPGGYQFQNRRLRSVGAHGQIDALTLVVDATGVPVTLHVEGEHPGLNGEIVPFTLDARLKDVGEPVTIKAP